MSGLVLNTAPTGQPVSLTEALLYARRVSGSPEDTLITSLIILGTNQVELITEHQLMDATYVQYFDCFSNIIPLDKPPLQTVTSVKYIDEDGNTQTIASTNYIVHNVNSHRGFIQFNFDYTFPALRQETIDSVFIEFVAGYESYTPMNSTIPEELLVAIKLQVNDLLEHRMNQEEGSDVGTLQLNETAKQILGSYRVFSPASIGFGSAVPQGIR